MAGTRKLDDEQIMEAHRMDAEGFSRPEIAAHMHNKYGIEIKRGGISKILGPVGKGEPQTIGTRPVQIWLTPEQAERARDRAREVGAIQLNMGPKTADGSISRLVREIADGSVTITRAS